MSRKNNILDLTEPKKRQISWYLYIYEHLKFHAQLSWAWKKFYNLEARSRVPIFQDYGTKYPIMDTLNQRQLTPRQLAPLKRQTKITHLIL